MLCSDPLLTFLKSFGYNVIRLPKADVKPLQLLARQGNSLNRLGDMATLLVAGSAIPIPPLSENVPAANLSGQQTGDLSLGLGLSILGNILGAMGGSKLGLETQYKWARTVSFEFSDVLEDRVEVAKLDQYLANADVNPFSRYVAQLLEADEIYITTATIKSKKFAVTAKKSGGGSLELSVPVLQQIVGGNVKVSGSGETTTKVVYEGPVPLVFGFQAVRLYYELGRYTAFKPLPAGGIGLRDLAQAPSDGAERLMADSAFVRISE